MGLLGPCNSKSIHKYLYCLRNITNSSRVQPDQTGHFCSNSFCVLKPKYNQEHNNITRKFWWLLLFMWRGKQQKAENYMLNKQIVQLWNNIPQYAVKGILKQLVLMQCFCINQLYFSPLSLVDSWLKYSVWDSTASTVQNSYLAKTITVVRGKEFPFPSGANFANSPIIVKCKPISSKTTAFQNTFSTA